MQLIARFIYSELFKTDIYYIVANKGVKVDNIDANNNADAIKQFKKWIKANKNKTDADIKEYLEIISK